MYSLPGQEHDTGLDIEQRLRYHGALDLSDSTEAGADHSRSTLSALQALARGLVASSVRVRSASDPHRVTEPYELDFDLTTVTSDDDHTIPTSPATKRPQQYFVRARTSHRVFRYRWDMRGGNWLPLGYTNRGSRGFQSEDVE